LPGEKRAATKCGFGRRNPIRTVGENGIHRRLRSDRSIQLARVVVTEPRAGAEPDEPETDVIRVYEDGRRRVVRDLRTGTRETHLNAALD
jgi:hypothetical protein